MIKDSVPVLVNMQRASVVVPSFLLFFHTCALHGPFLVGHQDWDNADACWRFCPFATNDFSRVIFSPWLDTADARIIQLEEGQLRVLQQVGTSKLRQFDRLKRWCDWLPEDGGWRTNLLKFTSCSPGCQVAEFEAPSWLPALGV